jgi:hypothetical protein
LQPFDIYTLGKIEEIEENMPQPVEQVQSDWDQNDENAPDHIKNRPFYTEINGTKLQEVQKTSSTTYFIWDNTISENTEYIVFVNDISYNVTAQSFFSGGATLAIPNVLQLYFDPQHAIIQSPNNGMLSGSGISENDVVKVYQGNINIQKLSSAYLDDDIARTIDVPTNLKNTNNHGLRLDAKNTTGNVGNYSLNLGYKCITDGNYSVAFNYSNLARGIYSTSFGYNNTAKFKSQYVFGEYNITDTSSGASTERGLYIEIAGNGTSLANRSNARTLDWDGNEQLAGTLRLGSTSGSGGVLLKADGNALKISFDNGTTWLTVSAS